MPATSPEAVARKNARRVERRRAARAAARVDAYAPSRAERAACEEVILPPRGVCRFTMRSR